MKILQIAPPWIPVPPPAYGGTEAVVDGLCRSLAARGHDVALVAPVGSECPVRRLEPARPVLGTERHTSTDELAHVLAAYDTARRWRPDVVHDHTQIGPVIGPTLVPFPVVATVHDPLRGTNAEVYREAARRGAVVAISHAQAAAAPDVDVAAVIHHGIDVASLPDLPNAPRGDHLLFLGRMAAEKGVGLAIDVARRAGLELLIAGKCRDPEERSFFAQEVEPRLDDRVRYVGEVDQHRKYELLSTARCLLNPIQWPEPFGMVMIEALAVGTPVVTTPRGAAPEIVIDGLTGVVTEDVEGLVEGVRAAPGLSSASCRASVVELFSTDRMAHDHEVLYEKLVDRASTSPVDDLVA